jgi:UDP-perosamine 4-acetyltransferase
VHATPRPIVGLGAGTHAKSVLDALRSSGEFEVVALVDDDAARVGTDLLGYPVRGPEALAELRDAGVADAFAGIGGVGSSQARKAAFARLFGEGFELPAIIHATASISPFARLGDGCHVLARTVVNADAELGDDVIVNTGAVVEHDCRIGPHVHLGPGVLLGGLVTVESDAHIGIGAVVIQELTIGAGAFVAAGAVVVEDVPSGARVAGVPARPMG